MSNWKVFQDSLDSESQPESERELSLSQLPNQPVDPLPPQEPRNEAGPSQQRRRPRNEEPLEPRQRRKIPSSRSLVIVIEVEPAFEGRPEAVFEGLFCNEDTEVQAWSQVAGVGHYRWLQGPLNHLTRARQLEYVGETMRHIFDYLRL
jgi:hypothetical protein